MATQSEPPTHAPVTLRGSVEKPIILPTKIYLPQREGEWGAKTQTE